jgi:hypothetical protein
MSSARKRVAASAAGFSAELAIQVGRDFPLHARTSDRIKKGRSGNSRRTRRKQPFLVPVSREDHIVASIGVRASSHARKLRSAKLVALKETYMIRVWMLTTHYFSDFGYRDDRIALCQVLSLYDFGFSQERCR